MDLGCGTGSLLKLIKTRYPNIDATGIDADEKILNIAQKKIRKNNLNIKFVKTSADTLPFPDSSFDVIVSTLVFHHLPTKVKIQSLKEVHRILKKNGRFLLVDFGKFTGPSKLLYYLLVLFRIPEAKTMKDNILEEKMPEYIKQANFKFTEISKRYLRIQFFLAQKL